MKTLTAADLIDQIAQLQIGQAYPYVSGRGTSTLEIIEIRKPEGPVRIARSSGSPATISKEQIAKIAFYCSQHPNYPLHIDRLFSGGGNTRSALETMLAHTPHFFICYPKRVDIYSGEILQNLKHIMWCPDEQHPLGATAEKIYDGQMSEALDLGVEFDRISVTERDLDSDFSTIEAKTTHIQMQIALVEIGNALNYETWIAKNDQHIPVGNATLGTLPGVIQSIDNIGILHNADTKDKAKLIDAIWFAEGKTTIAAVIEIEHTTGVTSGMTRMSKLYKALGSVRPEAYTIVAPDQLRNKVVLEASDPHFRPLNARFMPYSAVRELYSLVKRYDLRDTVTPQFVRAFMTTIVR